MISEDLQHLLFNATYRNEDKKFGKNQVLINKLLSYDLMIEQSSFSFTETVLR